MNTVSRRAFKRHFRQLVPLTLSPTPHAIRWARHNTAHALDKRKTEQVRHLVNAMKKNIDAWRRNIGGQLQPIATRDPEGVKYHLFDERHEQSRQILIALIEDARPGIEMIRQNPCITNASCSEMLIELGELYITASSELHSHLDGAHLQLVHDLTPTTSTPK